MTVFPYSAQSRFFIFVSSGVTVLKKVKMISVAIFLRSSCIFDRLTGLHPGHTNEIHHMIVTSSGTAPPERFIQGQIL